MEIEGGPHGTYQVKREEDWGWGRDHRCQQRFSCQHRFRYGGCLSAVIIASTPDPGPSLGLFGKEARPFEVKNKTERQPPKTDK